jgi:hypothetical protein
MGAIQLPVPKNLKKVFWLRFPHLELKQINTALLVNRDEVGMLPAPLGLGD